MKLMDTGAVAFRDSVESIVQPTSMTAKHLPVKMMEPALMRLMDIVAVALRDSAVLIVQLT